MSLLRLAKTNVKEAYLFNFSGHFEMLMILLPTNHEACAVSKLDIIFGNLGLVKLSRKVAIIDHLSRVDKAAAQLSATS